MKYLLDSLDAVERKVGNAPICLILDFDGTLAPIVKNPDRARLSAAMRRELGKCASSFPVAIISGRSLYFIQKKIHIPHSMYAGNHGLEWEIDGARGAIAMPLVTRQALRQAALHLRTLSSAFQGLVVEDKGLTLSLHYRNVPSRHLFSIRKKILAVVQQLVRDKYLIATTGKKVIELRPAVAWNKGKCAVFFLSHVQKKKRKKVIPIYIGDDTTDEDAFNMFTKNGVTIRIGKNNSSKAHYFLNTTQEVRLFIEKLRKMVR